MKALAISLIGKDILLGIIENNEISGWEPFPPFIFRKEKFSFDTPAEGDLVFSSFHQNIVRKIPREIIEEYFRQLIMKISEISKCRNTESVIMIIPDYLPEYLIGTMYKESCNKKMHVLLVRKTALSAVSSTLHKKSTHDNTLVMGKNILKLFGSSEKYLEVQNRIMLCIKTPDEQLLQLLDQNSELPAYTCFGFYTQPSIIQKEEYKLIILGKIGEEIFEVDDISLPDPIRGIDRYLLKINFNNTWTGKLELIRNNQEYLSKSIQYPFPIYVLGK